MKNGTRKSGGSGRDAVTSGGSTSSRHRSKTSAGPSKGSNKPSAPLTAKPAGRWKQPATLSQFAAQANAVATRVLNGEVPIELARSYSGLARTVSQAVSAQIVAARLMRTAPNLSLQWEAYQATGRK